MKKLSHESVSSKQATPIKKLSSIYLEDNEESKADIEDDAIEYQQDIISKCDSQHGRPSLEKIIEEYSDEEEEHVEKITILHKNDSVSKIGIDDSSDSSDEL